ncbi:MAG TPA: RIP metalloprotease RseP [Bacteroidetes bacterium]|nr:RIP metalloprotease RseP [Bacteroidota bacterium]
MLVTILATVFVLGVLVFIHEFGHFIAAKMVGIRVETFSIGYPPRLFGKKIGNTDYCISAIPFGGYVKMAGMIDESLDKEGLKGEPWEFQSKPVPHRMAAILAGPLMNYVLAIAIFAGLVMFHGIGEISGDRIGSVIPDFPATKAGIVPGDRIVAINGEKIDSWDEMTIIIHNLPNRNITLEWEHEGTILSDTMTTRAEKAPIDGDIREIGLVGIGPELTMKKVGFFSAVGYGFDRTIYLTRLVYVSLKMLVSGQESLKSIGGPVVIAKLAGESARSGFGSLLAFMAFLSLNLAFLNILPIPALDGGHLLFLLVEAVTRKPLSTKVRVVIQQVGMAILLALMVFVVINDVKNVFF